MNNAKIKKCLLNKDQILGTSGKTWFKDEAESVTEKSFVKTSKILKVVPQSMNQLDEMPSKQSRVCIIDPLKQ